MITQKAINKAFEVCNVPSVFDGEVQISDLGAILGIGERQLMIIRGDLAFPQIIASGIPTTPKFWVFHGILQSERIQKALAEDPNAALFDGVGFSGLAALAYWAKKIGRKAVMVMAKEHIPDAGFVAANGVEVIHGELPAEEGYVAMQAKVLRERAGQIVPFHQALFGASAMAPIGNRIEQLLYEMNFLPHESYWCMAGGSNLYGIGSILRSNAGTRVICVEPETERTIPPQLDLGDPQAVREFANRELGDYSLADWDGRSSLTYPLHVRHINRYVLLNWRSTGQTHIDQSVGVSAEAVAETQDMLRRHGLIWTKTTALALTPALEAARNGRRVIVMAYGRG